MALKPKYARVLLKVSGEALMGEGAFGIDTGTVERIAADVKEAVEAGTQVCMVIGGGNIFRGLAGAAKGIDRATADVMVKFYSVLLHQHTTVISAWSAASRAALEGPYGDPGIWGAFMLTLSHADDVSSQ